MNWRCHEIIIQLCILFNLYRIKAVGLEAWKKDAGEIRKKYFKGTYHIGKGTVLEQSTQ